MPPPSGLNGLPAPCPSSRSEGLVGAQAPRTSGGAVGNGLGGSQARREVSRAGAAPRGRDGGSEAGTRGIGGRGRDPSIPESPGSLAALAELGSWDQPPPHPRLLTSRCLSLRFHHNPSPSRRHCPSHFPLSCLSGRGKLRPTPRPAKQKRHFRSGKHRLPRPGCLRIGWSDGLPEAAGRGLGASCEVPAGMVSARVWLSTRECRASAGRLAPQPQTRGVGPPWTPAGPPKPRQPLTCSVVSVASRGLRARPRPGCGSQIRGLRPRPRRDSFVIGRLEGTDEIQKPFTPASIYRFLPPPGGAGAVGCEVRDPSGGCRKRLQKRSFNPHNSPVKSPGSPSQSFLFYDTNYLHIQSP